MASRGAKRANRVFDESRADRADPLGDKLYFKIGEAAAIVGVEPHVLRFWEDSFAALQPTRSRSRQRVYRRQDVALALRIRGLLHDEGLTIAGARQRLREEPSGPPPPPAITARVRRSAAAVSEAISDLQAEVQRVWDPAVDADPWALLERRAAAGAPAQGVFTRPQGTSPRIHRVRRRR